MKIRLMSHNVWGMYAPDVVGGVFNRNELMRDIYLEELPDAIGTQEFSEDIRIHGLPEMIAPAYRELDLSEVVAAYGMKNLFTPIFYRVETLEVLDRGFELYDRAYNNHDSKGAAWAVFRHKASGEVFTLCNTHYWWRSGEEHDRARVGNSRVVLSLMERLPKPFFVMGDLNCRVDSEAYRTLLAGGLADVQRLAADTVDSNTHHAYPTLDRERGLFGGAPKPNGGYDKSIDHILVDADHGSGARVFRILTHDNACNTSDHCPVYVDWES
ncbi:MAG: hypothetical protein E7620_03920 [Ruminococcaceae bacterium]|nr:hypothetical protein [Oscillospiraceae bacterium]